MSDRRLKGILVLVLAAVLVAVPRASAWSAETITTTGREATRASYYLALGDSLTLGVQPDETGADRPTEFGYANVLFDQLRASDPALTMVNLACAGETTTTFLAGGQCSYGRFSSQLIAAAVFLLQHRGQVKLITIDLGSNDIGQCVSAVGIDERCVTQALQTIRDKLTIAALVLRFTAGRRTPLVGANFYDPVLAAWLLGAPGQDLAKASLRVTEKVNTLVEQIYGGVGVAVADVETAFQTFDQTSVVLPGVGEVPLNVARICEWTWTCTPPPIGPNPHPNNAGYRVIADAFAAELQQPAARRELAEPNAQ